VLPIQLTWLLCLRPQQRETTLFLPIRLIQTIQEPSRRQQPSSAAGTGYLSLPAASSWPPPSPFTNRFVASFSDRPMHFSISSSSVPSSSGLSASPSSSSWVRPMSPALDFFGRVAHPSCFFALQPTLQIHPRPPSGLS
jgi:hypothetical protein